MDGMGLSLMTIVGFNRLVRGKIYRKTRHSMGKLWLMVIVVDFNLLVLSREWMGCWGLLGLSLKTMIIMDHSIIPY